MTAEHNQLFRQTMFEYAFDNVAWTPEFWVVPYTTTPYDWDASTSPLQVLQASWTTSTTGAPDYDVSATVAVDLQWDNVAAATYNGVSVYKDSAALDTDLLMYAVFTTPAVATVNDSIRVSANSIKFTFADV